MTESSPILGRWRITSMEQWDQSFVDAEVEGYIRFDPDGDGEFQFGYVRGSLSWEAAERASKPAAEWAWEGSDEMDPASGRGWVVLRKDGSLKGKLTLHDGSSMFTAVRK